MSDIPHLDIQKRENLREQTYLQLRNAILRGPIRPGTVLVQEQLAEHLGISRTPVRDALDRLASEGLVVRSPGGRIQVAPFSVEELREKYLVRRALEVLALRLAAPRMPGEPLTRLKFLIAAMRQDIADGKAQLVAQGGAAFHDTIFAACGNTYLRQLLTNLNDSIRRYRHAAIDIPGRAAETLREHSQIYECLASGDIAAAQHAMEDHITQSQQRLEQDFRQGEPS
jgi:DNA-binding GntR family transcriptional regulator